MSQSLKQNSRKVLPLSSNVLNKMIPVSPVRSETFSKQSGVEQIAGRNGNPIVTPQSVIIGTTTYDLQTNKSNCNRIYQKNDTVGAIWNMSFDFSGIFPDRGTGYNFYNGSVWSTIPISSTDSIAWSNIDLGSNNTEYIVGHNRISMVDDLVLFKRTPQ